MGRSGTHRWVGLETLLQLNVDAQGEKSMEAP
jgi:hypothetical protein